MKSSKTYQQHIVKVKYYMKSSMNAKGIVPHVGLYEVLAKIGIFNIIIIITKIILSYIQLS